MTMLREVLTCILEEIRLGSTNIDTDVDKLDNIEDVMKTSKRLSKIAQVI